MAKRDNPRSDRLRPSLGSYSEMLESFGAREKTAAESVAHLVSLGFQEGQARNAVYRFRQKFLRPRQSNAGGETK